MPVCPDQVLKPVRVYDDTVPGGVLVKKLPLPVRKILDFGLAHAT